jgi:hypothetical protein
MADRNEEDKEGDGSDIRGLDGDWKGDQPLERNEPNKDGHDLRYNVGDQRAESDGLFKAAAISKLIVSTGPALGQGSLLSFP